MSSFFWSPLQGGSGGGVTTYANFAAFPSAGSAGNGALAIALDTGILYEVIAGVWTAIAGPGAALSIGSPANGLSIAANVLSLGLSSTSTTGALSNTDWNIFNNKQASGNYITALTGDGTASGPGSAALTLTTVNSNVGSFGTASNVSTFTVNGKGLITAASNTAILITESQVTNLVSDLAGKQATGNYITALTGDATASGPGSAALTLATVNSNVGSFTNASITVNAKGLITAASSGTTAVTSISVASANGLAGTSSGGATPALTLSTTITGILQGNGTAISAATTTGSGSVVLATSPTLVTPNLGTPSALVGTNITGTASGLTAGTVTTNANLTGPITSVGNATSVAAQTGTGSVFVMQASPTLTTPVIGAATGTSLSVSGQLTSTVATGTAPLVVSSTTQVANLNAATAGSATTATTATNATNIATTATNSTNASFFPTFVASSSSGNQGADTATGLSFNPSTNTLTTTTFSGALSGNATTSSNTTGNASTVTTNANMTGDVTSVGNATTYAGTVPLNKGGTGQTTKAAAFDALQPMTTGGDIIYGGASGTGTRLANGSANQVLISNGGTAAPSWAANSPTYNYTAQTTTYSAVINDCILCTSGTFTITLPTAVGQSGKRISINNSGSGVITLATTSSQTIMGLASAKILLATANDSIEIYSDGANWQVLVFNINVSARYFSSSSSVSSSYGTLTYATKDYDSYSQYASGTYTIVIPGKYQINAGAVITATYVTGQFADVGIFKGATQFSEAFVSAGGANGTMGVVVADIIDLAAADTILIKAKASGTSPSISASNFANYFSIKRIG